MLRKQFCSAFDLYNCRPIRFSVRISAVKFQGFLKFCLNTHKSQNCMKMIELVHIKQALFLNTNWNSNVLQSSDSLSFEANILEFLGKKLEFWENFTMFYLIKVPIHWVLEQICWVLKPKKSAWLNHYLIWIENTLDHRYFNNTIHMIC